MVTKNLLFFFFTLVNCSIAFGAQNIGDDLFKGGLGFDKDSITSVPPSLSFQKIEQVCTNYNLSVRTFYLVDEAGKRIKYDDKNNIIPVEDHYNHKVSGKYSTVVNHSGNQEAAPVLIKVITSPQGEIMYSIEDEGGSRNLAIFEVESQNTQDFLVQLEGLATQHRSNLVFLQLYDNRTRLPQKIEVRQDQLIEAQAKAKKLLEEKRLAAKPVIQMQPKKSIPVPKGGRDSLKDALAQLEENKDQNFSLQDFKLPHRTSDISPSDYFNSLLPDQRKACLSAAYNHDLQKVAKDPAAFSKMADMSPQKYFSELSEEKRQEFHQSVYDLHKEKNTDAKKILFHKLSTDLKQQLEQWNDPKDEEKKAKLVDFVTHVFYACHNNDDLRLDFKDISNKLFTAIRYEEKSKDGIQGHAQVASKSAPLTDKFNEIAKTAEHRLQQDLPLYNKCVQATNKINAKAAELEEENNRPFGQYVKDSVRGTASEVVLPVVAQEFGECIGLVIASLIDNPATKKEIVRLEKDVQDLKEILADPDNNTEKYKKDLQKALFQKVQANQKLINGDNSKKTKTKEELLQAFKDLNEGK